MKDDNIFSLSCKDKSSKSSLVANSFNIEAISSGLEPYLSILFAISSVDFSWIAEEKSLEEVKIGVVKKSQETKKIAYELASKLSKGDIVVLSRRLRCRKD